MATVRRLIAAPPDRVFAVLADGWSYSNWVVGTSHIRAVEPTWPAVGARIHHSSGNWPLTLDDSTVVESVEPDRGLVLTAHGQLLGSARIAIGLQAEGARTRVTLSETPSSGPGRWLHNPVSELALHARNTESLARLAATVERHGVPGG